MNRKFPKFMRINPMLRKELLVSMRTVRMTILMIIFNVILATIGLTIFNVILEDVKWSGSLDYSSTIALYVTLVCIQFGLLVIIVPAMTSGAITGERERQTLDILFSTTMTPFQVLLGKLLSSITAVVLLIISSFPIVALIFVFGGISFGDILVTVLFLIFTTIYAGVIGLACSVRFKKTTTATVFSYGLILFIGVGTIFLVTLCAIISAVRYPYEANIGPLSGLLFLNPGITLAALLMEQVGSMDEFVYIMEEIGVFEALAEHWVITSMIAQAGFIALLMIGSVKRLNPIKRKKR